MKVFVATKEGQGLRESDYFGNLEEGDLVRFVFECDRDADTVDGGCGCRRGMGGVEARGGTTTFKVADLDITEPEYLKKVLGDDYNEYIELKEDNSEEDRADNEYQMEIYEERVKELLEAASVFPVGIILEKRGDDIQPRPSISWTRKFEDEEDEEG